MTICPAKLVITHTISRQKQKYLDWNKLAMGVILGFMMNKSIKAESLKFWKMFWPWSYDHLLGINHLGFFIGVAVNSV